MQILQEGFKTTEQQKVCVLPERMHKLLSHTFILLTIRGVIEAN